MPIVLALLALLACGRPTAPDPAVHCASVEPSVVTVEQISAVARTQAHALESLAGAQHPPVLADHRQRRDDPRRLEASHTRQLAVLCPIVADVALAVAGALPSIHPRRVRAAAEDLARSCRAGSGAVRAFEALEDALASVHETCDSFGSEATPDPATSCQVAGSTLEPLLKPLSATDATLAALAEQRAAYLAASAITPFDPDAVADPLSALGAAEGDHTARCDRLVRLVDGHTARHRAVLALEPAHDALSAFSEQCRVGAGEIPPASAASQGAAVLGAYRSLHRAYESALDACRRDGPPG